MPRKAKNQTTEKPRTWVASVSCSDPRDDYTIRVMARSAEEALAEARANVWGRESVSGVYPARSRK
jgi:hypothetical protein